MSITLLLVLINALVSWRCFEDRALFNRLSHRPFEVAHSGQYERWVTSGFVHAGWMHLGINMFVLWQFGTIVEDRFTEMSGVLPGRLRFMAVYFIILVASGLPTFLKHRNQPGYASVGASGAVSGILFSYVLFYPWEPIYLYGIIPITSIIAAAGYLAYSSWASRQGRGMINHDAHFYGAVSGFLITSLFYPESFLAFLHDLLPG